VPHLSLLMCYVKESSVKPLLERRNCLYSVSSGTNLQSSKVPFQNLSLRSKDLSLVDVGKDLPILSWGIEKSDVLQKLQEELVQNFQEFFEFPDEAGMRFAFDGDVEDSTIEWTRQYLQKSLGEGFDPHITIGFWSGHSSLPKSEEIIIEWMSDVFWVSVFQLGNHCTCRLRRNLTTEGNFVSFYKDTLYLVDAFPEESIRVGAYHPFLDELLEENGYQEWAYMTAWNPYSIDLSSFGKGIRNLERNRKLLETIQEEGWPFYPGKGVGKDPQGRVWSEESFLILGISKADSERLAAFWEQNSYLYGKRGKVAELMGGSRV